MQKSCCSYPVEYVTDVFGESPVLAETLRKITGVEVPRLLIVADSNVVRLQEGIGAKIGRYVQTHKLQLAAAPVVMPGGEKIKSDNLQSALRVISAMLAAKLGKRDVVLALGGGAILDVAGYAAAQVRGGVPLVRLPTTPVAMIESAFTDYAAVDSATIKDALRVPSVPAAVMIDPTLGLTVLDGVWRSGVAAAVRQAVSSDATLMKKLAKWVPAYMAHDKAVFCEMMTAVCQSRQKKGATTFAQWAIERLQAMSGYKLPHGYALAVGMCLDLAYAVEKGVLAPADRDAVIALLQLSGSTDGITHSGHLLCQSASVLNGLEAWAAQTGDAKIVLPCKIGKLTEIEAPDLDCYRKALKDLLALQRPPAEAK